jgi:hypothetical protein
MSPLPGRYLLLALLAGAVWGAIGMVLAGRTLGLPVWGGAVASPVIGLAIAVLFRGFRQRPIGARIALALVSLYLGAGLFALAVGVADAVRPIGPRDAMAVVIQTVLGVWWGITFTGYLPLLWPLAYLTHSLLGRADRGGSGFSGYRPIEAERTTAQPASPARDVSARDATQRPRPREELRPGTDRTPQERRARRVHGLVRGVLALVGLLVVWSALRGGRGPLGGLIILLVGAGLAFLGARAGWRWFRNQPAAIATVGVLGAFVAAGAGWLLVAIVRALSHVSGENYGMIVVWPIMFAAAVVAVCAGVLAIAMSGAAAYTALTRAFANRALIVIGAVVAVTLNVLHIVALTRLLFTG